MVRLATLFSVILLALGTIPATPARAQIWARVAATAIPAPGELNPGYEVDLLNDSMLAIGPDTLFTGGVFQTTLGAELGLRMSQMNHSYSDRVIILAPAMANKHPNSWLESAMLPQILYHVGSGPVQGLGVGVTVRFATRPVSWLRVEMEAGFPDLTSSQLNRSALYSLGMSVRAW